MEVFSWIADNIFGTPAIMLGAIVLVGLVLQKKDFSHVMMGTCKAIIGFLIINSGSNIITGALNIFSPVWQEVRSSIDRTRKLPRAGRLHCTVWQCGDARHDARFSYQRSARALYAIQIHLPDRAHDVLDDDYLCRYCRAGGGWQR